jgi:hypothetical protein
VPTGPRSFGGIIAATWVQDLQVVSVEESEMIEVPLNTGQMHLPDLLSQRIVEPAAASASMKNLHPQLHADGRVG